MNFGDIVNLKETIKPAKIEQFFDSWFLKNEMMNIQMENKSKNKR